MNTSIRNQPVCTVCGGCEYVKDQGFYYCQECQTQSQDLREEVFETIEGLQAVSQTTKIKKRTESVLDHSIKKDQGKEWTTWEGYNFILKGQVEELISLGVHPSYRRIILQLWTYYLSKLEVAFTSKYHKRRPKLGPSFHPKNYKVVYGVALEKTKRKTSGKCSVKKSVTMTSNVDLGLNKIQLFKKKKRALIAAESQLYTSTEVESLLGHSSNLNDTSEVDSSSEATVSENTTSISSHRIQYSKVAREIIKSPSFKRKKASEISRMHFYYNNPSILTHRKLLAILYIGLLYIEDTVQLSDMLRWLREGHISYQDVAHFFPESYKFQGSDNQIFSPGLQLPSRKNLQLLTSRMATYLGVTELPKPNLLNLITRYVNELQLPAMLTTLAERFIATAPLSVQWKRVKELPNCEGRAMAIIIVILKLLFGLDDRTEHTISSTAATINRLVIEDRRHDRRRAFPPLFIWDDWMSYIICRRALLIRHHFPTKHLIFPESFDNPDLLVDFLKGMKSKSESKEDKIFHFNELINKPELVQSMKRPFERLAKIYPMKDKRIEFPPSLTPLTTYTECIKAFHSSDAAGELQTQDFPVEMLDDFTATDLTIFLHPEPYVAFAEERGYNIIVKRKSAHKYFRKLKKFNIQRENPYVLDTSRKHLAIHVLDANKTRNVCNGHSLRSNKQRISQNEQSKRKTPTGDKCVKNSKLPVAAADWSSSELSSDEDNVHSCTPSEVSEPDEYRANPINGHETGVHSELPEEAGTLLSKLLKGEGIQNEEETGTSSTVNGNRKRVIVSSRCTKQKLRRTRRKVKNLYIPYSKYWMFDGTLPSKFPESQFHSSIASKFPVNFNWLLTECAYMLEMSNRDLYREVLYVERGCLGVSA